MLTIHPHNGSRGGEGGQPYSQSCSQSQPHALAIAVVVAPALELDIRNRMCNHILKYTHNRTRNRNHTGNRSHTHPRNRTRYRSHNRIRSRSPSTRNCTSRLIPCETSIGTKEFLGFVRRLFGQAFWTGVTVELMRQIHRMYT